MVVALFCARGLAARHDEAGARPGFVRVAGGASPCHLTAVSTEPDGILRATMTPVLESLRSAVTTTREVLERCEDRDTLAQLDRPTRLGLRAGLIKHFELTYELSWKVIQRRVRDFLGARADIFYTRRDMFRHAGELGLIGSVERWMDHHEARNLTAHTDNEETARRILAAIPGFLDDFGKLIRALESGDV